MPRVCSYSHYFIASQAEPAPLHCEVPSQMLNLGRDNPSSWFRSGFLFKRIFSIVFLSPKNIFSIGFFFPRNFESPVDSLTHVLKFAGGCQHQYCSYRCRSRISSSWNALTATYWTSGLLEYSGATSRWRTLITRGVGLFVCLLGWLVVWLIGWLVGCLLVLFFCARRIADGFFSCFRSLRGTYWDAKKRSFQWLVERRMNSPEF